MTLGIKSMGSKPFISEEDCPYHEQSCRLVVSCPCPKYKAMFENGSAQMLSQYLKAHPSERLQIIFDLQEKFVREILDYNDMIGRKDHWTAEYQVSILDEISEVLQHIHWKHWKKPAPDQVVNVKELQKELIDLVHFIVNMALVWEMESYVVTAMNHYIEISFLANEPIIHNIPRQTRENATKELLIELAKNIFSIPSGIHASTEFAYMHIINAFGNLLAICNFWDMNGLDIYKAYIKKNAENIARQKFGY